MGARLTPARSSTEVRVVLPKRKQTSLRVPRASPTARGFRARILLHRTLGGALSPPGCTSGPRPMWVLLLHELVPVQASWLQSGTRPLGSRRNAGLGVEPRLTASSAERPWPHVLACKEGPRRTVPGLPKRGQEVCARQSPAIMSRKGWKGQDRKSWSPAAPAPSPSRQDPSPAVPTLAFALRALPGCLHPAPQPGSKMARLGGGRAHRSRSVRVPRLPQQMPSGWGPPATEVYSLTQDPGVDGGRAPSEGPAEGRPCLLQAGPSLSTLHPHAPHPTAIGTPVFGFRADSANPG